MQLGLGPHHTGHRCQRAFEYGVVEEQQGVQSLVLGGRRDVVVDREMGQKGRNLDFTHGLRMAMVMELNEAPYPVDIGLLGTDAVVTHAHGGAYTFEKRR